MDDKVKESKFIINTMNEYITSFSTLQGTIGAGKSTLLKKIQNYIKVNKLSIIDDYDENNKEKNDYFLVVDEPLGEWLKPIYSTERVNEDNRVKERFKAHEQSFYSNFGCLLFFSIVFALFSPFAAQTQYEGFIIRLFTTIWIINFVYISCEFYYNSPKEDVDTVVKDISILDLFYSNMKQYAFLFQIKAFTSRLQKIIETLNKIKKSPSSKTRIHIIAERSLRTDRLFFKNLYDNGTVTEVEWMVYNEFFTLICEEVVRKENVMIYVHTSPWKCQERIEKRAREAELKKNDKGGIPLEYLKSLDKAHDEMIDEFSKENKVFTLDFNLDMEDEELNDMTNNLMNNLIDYVSQNNMVDDDHDDVNTNIKRFITPQKSKDEKEKIVSAKQRFIKTSRKRRQNNEERIIEVNTKTCEISNGNGQFKGLYTTNDDDKEEDEKDEIYKNKVNILLNELI